MPNQATAEGKITSTRKSLIWETFGTEIKGSLLQAAGILTGCYLEQELAELKQGFTLRHRWPTASPVF